MIVFIGDQHHLDQTSPVTVLRPGKRMQIECGRILVSIVAGPLRERLHRYPDAFFVSRLAIS